MIKYFKEFKFFLILKKQIWRLSNIFEWVTLLDPFCPTNCDDDGINNDLFLDDTDDGNIGDGTPWNLS